MKYIIGGLSRAALRDITGGQLDKCAELNKCDIQSCIDFNCIIHTNPCLAYCSQVGCRELACGNYSTTK